MIIAFTGAGISKASGISTFMEQPEVRNKLYRSFAQSNPIEYRNTVKTLKESIDMAQPNDAHRALFEYDIPVITMNIDGLHELAGSAPITLHGTLPTWDEMDTCHILYNKPVLYGDPAPRYQEAFELVSTITDEDTLLIIGASTHTAVAQDLRDICHFNGVNIIEIQDNADTKTRKTLKSLTEKRTL